MNETDLKGQLKDYLSIKGIFSFPIIQGLGSYRGAPDRVMHLEGQVHYLEIKLPKGVMSQYQINFQEQCLEDGVGYHVIRSLDDLMGIIG